MRIFRVCLLALLASAGFLATACEILPQPEPMPTFIIPPTPTPSSGTLYTVQKGNIVEDVAARGRIVAAREAFLSFKLGGSLKALNIANGDQVTKDAILAELEAANLESDVSDAQYGLEASRLKLNKAKAQQLEVSKAKLEVERSKAKADSIDVQLESARQSVEKRKGIRYRAWEYYKGEAWKGGKAADDAYAAFDRADADYIAAVAAQKSLEIDKKVNSLDTSILQAIVDSQTESARAEADIAQKEVEHAQALLEKARTRLSDTKLRAPFSGVIVSIEAKLGDKVEPYQAIGAIADPSKPQVEVNIPEADIGRVSVGQASSMTLDANPQQRYSGKVKEIASKATIWQGKNVFKVIMGFDDVSKVPASIRMGTDVRITTKVKENVIIIPSRAVLTDGQRKYVEVAEAGKIERGQIQTGIFNENETEVLSGLSEKQVIRIP